MPILAFANIDVTLDSLQKHLTDGTQLDLSSTCREDFLVYLQHLRYGSDWALKMFDSSGKLDSGVLKGGHIFVGFYSECLDALPQSSVPQNVNESSPPPPSFASAYCTSQGTIGPKES
ncbi:hypothetical protein MTO96_023359 [Rhipicephalus appendiculatus]